jgi:ABC-type Mn2+/Zn2+ transport system permease subunit
MNDEGFSAITLGLFFQSNFDPDFVQVKGIPFTISDFPTLVHLAPCLTAAFAIAMELENKRTRTDIDTTNFLFADFIFTCGVLTYSLSAKQRRHTRQLLALQ